jgi:4'-phosphopantetheinyl transferase
MPQAVVDVYLADTDACNETADGLAVLSREERDRADRFRFDRDRRSYVARRATLRSLLSQYLACAPRDVPICTGPHGKLFVADSTLRFNVSHSGGLALYVVAHGLDVGCDIEFHDGQVAINPISERFFSPAERQALERFPANGRIAAFFDLWTRKEAVLKASGLGLSVPLDSFDVSPLPAERIVSLRNDGRWLVRSVETIANHSVAIAASGADWRLDVRPGGLISGGNRCRNAPSGIPVSRSPWSVWAPTISAH